MTVSLLYISTRRTTSPIWLYLDLSFLQYWGELGYFRIVLGHNALGIESTIAWATPGAFTVHNFPCNEDGGNCNGSDEGGVRTQHYVDPSKSREAYGRRLQKA